MPRLVPAALPAAVLAVAVAAACGGASVAPESAGDGDDPLCAAATTPIPAIQGAGAASPLAGRVVTTTGVVTGDFQGDDELRGFFLQDPAGDGDAATADGLFVFDPRGREVAAGDRVAVRGRVTEHHGLTELARIEALAVCGRGEVEATAVELAAATGEAREGTLVRLATAPVVVDTFGLAETGRLVVGERRPLHDAEGGASLVVDDGSAVPGRVPILHLAGGTLRAGARLAPFRAVVAEVDGAWVAHPVEPLAMGEGNPRPASPPAVGGALRVVSFNVHNYFTTLGERGAADAQALARQRAKLAAALRGLDADVVAVQEAENVAGSLPDLAAALVAAGAGEDWRAVADPTSGTGDDAIKNGFLYRAGRVRPVGPARADADPAHERPPVAQTFAADDDEDGARLTVAVTHLKSKRCDDAAGDDADAGDGVGCFDATRVRQAAALARFVARLAAETGDPDVLLVGDFNAYGGEAPLAVLRVAGLVDLTESRLPAEDRYSYVYRGVAGDLDHAFATPDLAADVAGVAFWHVNADEPEAYDYHRAGHFTPDAYRSSDHDPLVVGLDPR